MNYCDFIDQNNPDCDFLPDWILDSFFLKPKTQAVGVTVCLADCFRDYFVVCLTALCSIHTGVWSFLCDSS